MAWLLGESDLALSGCQDPANEARPGLRQGDLAVKGDEVRPQLVVGESLQLLPEPFSLVARHSESALRGGWPGSG
jgi:hypothetical protein